MSKLKFNIEKPGTVKLEIYNLVGMKLDELPAGHLETGEHTIQWKPKYNFSGSVLNYKVELDKEVVTEKLFVVK